MLLLGSTCLLAAVDLISPSMGPRFNSDGLDSKGFWMNGLNSEDLNSVVIDSKGFEWGCCSTDGCLNWSEDSNMDFGPVAGVVSTEPAIRSSPWSLFS